MRGVRQRLRLSIRVRCGTCSCAIGRASMLRPHTTVPTMHRSKMQPRTAARAAHVVGTSAALGLGDPPCQSLALVVQVSGRAALTSLFTALRTNRDCGGSLAPLTNSRTRRSRAHHTSLPRFAPSLVGAPSRVRRWAPDASIGRARRAETSICRTQPGCHGQLRIR